MEMAVGKISTVRVEIFLNNAIVRVNMLSKNLIEDFFFRSFEFRGVPRELKISESEKISSIVGPRRAGKTWYFYSLLPLFSHPMYVNFEDIGILKKSTRPGPFLKPQVVCLKIGDCAEYIEI